MMPPPVNFEPTRVPTVDLVDASRVTFKDVAAAPAPAPPVQKIYMRTQAPVEATPPPAPPPREAPPTLNVPDKVRAYCTLRAGIQFVNYE